MSHGVTIEARNVKRVHQKGRTGLTVLDRVDFRIDAGEMVAVVGKSGSGKSTLMHLLGLLDKPTSGRILIDGIDTARQSGRKLARIRNRRIGFVFQAHHLLPEHSALSNVMMPVRLSGSRRRASTLLRWSWPASAQPPCWKRSVWQVGSTTSPASSPEGSSSAWRSPARWLWARA